MDWIKNLIEKVILPGKPWNEFLLQYRITPLSAEIPSPAQILFGRKFRSNLTTIMPSQLINSKIKQQKELTAKKEDKFYVQNTNYTTEMSLEVGQKICHQDQRNGLLV